jgi:hypothetical protein
MREACRFSRLRRVVGRGVACPADPILHHASLAPHIDDVLHLVLVPSEEEPPSEHGPGSPSESSPLDESGSAAAGSSSGQGHEVGVMLFELGGPPQAPPEAARRRRRFFFAGDVMRSEDAWKKAANLWLPAFAHFDGLGPLECPLNMKKEAAAQFPGKKHWRNSLFLPGDGCWELLGALARAGRSTYRVPVTIPFGNVAEAVTLSSSSAQCAVRKVAFSPKKTIPLYWGWLSRPRWRRAQAQEARRWRPRRGL